MRTIFFIIICALPFFVFAQDKSQFDLEHPGLMKAATTADIAEPEYLMTSNDFLEISLTKQGYFTIGTTSGLSDSRLDDHCQITFGHPYALTSYPVFSVDGKWHNIAEYFNNPDSTGLYQESGSLIFSGRGLNGINIDFGLVAKTQTAAVEFILKISNTDTVAHSVAPGFMLDPALGQWGDGAFKCGDTDCSRDMVMNYDQLSGAIQIWEKNSGARGIGSELSFTSGDPEKIILANWHDVYDDITPMFTPSELRDLYDLMLKIYWPAVELAANAHHEIRWELKLTDPDFSSKVFTRWDVPAYLSMDNGIMFPGKMKTTLATYNPQSQQLQNLELVLELPKSMSTLTSQYLLDLDANDSFYQPVELEARLVYEDRIVDIIADVYQDNIKIESFKHKMFIPATPVSDTGLVILNDSISTENFPETEVIFSVEQEATGQRILNLNEDNIFLYENNIRMHDFSLGKFSGGGSNLADVVFVLDISGSMGDEKDQVVAYLGEFADSLAVRGYDCQIGLVTFSTDLDQIVDLTKDIDHIRQVLNSISLWGGVEDSPLALYRASELSFRPGSRRNIIWITDEAYPEHSYTVEEIVNRMLSMDITVHGVGLLTLQTNWFNPIIIPTGGTFYNITGNFRDILLDVTRFEAQDTYLLKYTSNITAGETITLKMEIHYAGLGVIKTYNIASKTGQKILSKLECFPNPFNPEITLQIFKPDKVTGEVVIYNVLGQRIHKFDIPQTSSHRILWKGRNDQGKPVGSGIYIVQLTLRDSQGITHRESARILYLK